MSLGRGRTSQQHSFACAEACREVLLLLHLTKCVSAILFDASLSLLSDIAGVCTCTLLVVLFKLCFHEPKIPDILIK